MAPLLTPTQILSIVKKLRDDIARTSNTTPISIRQHKTSIDPSDRSGSTSTSLPGTVVSKVILPAAQAFAHDARELLHSAIAHLGPGEFPRPEIQPVQGEWLGYSVGRKASPATAGVDVSRDNYRRICETTSDTVIFFVYGGLFFTNSKSVRVEHDRSLCQCPYQPHALLESFDYSRQGNVGLDDELS